jgi:hypothetical protein
MPCGRKNRQILPGEPDKFAYDKLLLPGDRRSLAFMVIIIQCYTEFYMFWISLR